MADEQENFSQETVRTGGMKRRVSSFHGRMTEADLRSVKDKRTFAGLWIYRFGMIMTAEIQRTELTRRAAALTYTTILSLFPLLAVITASLSLIYTPEKQKDLFSYIERQFLPSMNADNDIPLILRSDVRANIEAQQEKGENIRHFFADVSEKFRNSAGGVGIFGFIGLLVTGGLLYYSIESVVNQTWREEDRARWVQTITNFIVILVLAPIILALSITTTTIAYSFLDPKYVEKLEAAQDAVQEVKKAKEAQDAQDAAAAKAATMQEAAAAAEPENSDYAGPFLPKADVPAEPKAAAAPKVADVPTSHTVKLPIGGTTMRDRIRQFTVNFGFILPLLPVLINVLILTCAYAFLPKTRVQFLPALVGGLTASLLWELAKYLFVFYIYGSAVNRTLAGAFGLSILFLIWVYITWVILLLGNLLVYVVQNFDGIWSELRTGGEIMLDSRLYLATMLLLARRFTQVGGGYTELELRARLGLNQVEFRRILHRLVRGGFISPLANDSYQVAQPPERILVRSLLQQGCNLSQLPVVKRGRSSLTRLFENLEERTLGLCGDSTLADLLQEMAAGRQNTAYIADQPQEQEP